MASTYALHISLLWVPFLVRTLASTATALNLTFMCHNLDNVPGQATTLGSAMTIAIDKINSNTSIVQHIVLDFTWDDTGCDVGTALDKVVKSVYLQGSAAIIGAACPEVTISISQLAKTWNVPVMGFMSLSLELSDKHKYPTYGRSISPVTNIAEAIVRVCQHFQWNHVALIGSNHEHPWGDVEEAILHVFQEENFTMAPSVIFDTENPALYEDSMRQVASKARIIILAASKNASREMLLVASSLGYTNGDYVFFFMDLYSEYDLAVSIKITYSRILPSLAVSLAIPPSLVLSLAFHQVSN
ncbi:guanylate cyclase 2G-like [Saccoglossus kowalevskii]